MSKRARVLVVDSNLHTLSKIYLSLIHKDYKVEATDDAQEIMARIERFKPALIILNAATKNLCPNLYQEIAQKKVKVLLIKAAAALLPVETRKLEVIEMPKDIGFFDLKIRDLLNILD